MQGLLSFDQSPPLGAPLRFFLTAPLFGVLAGLLLLIEGPDLLISRWTPAALAMLHLMTLGFMMQVVFGALIQVLPVVAGANIEKSERVATLVHFFLSAGTILLAAGFWFGLTLCLNLGAGCLTLAVLVFLLATGRAMLPVPSSSPTIRGIKVALFGLAGVLLLGVFLVHGLQAGMTISLVALTDLHAGWGFAAWGGVLVMAMAYVVVPMFQLTPAYSSRTAWAVPLLLLALVVFWSLAVVWQLDTIVQFSKAGVAILGVVFAVWTLRLQSRRRRAKRDAHSAYWQLSMVCLILACFFMLTAAMVPALGEWDGRDFMFALLLLPGAFVSCITGMMYKIVPFLSWLHLQNQGQGKVMAPNVNRLLPERDAMRQFLFHCSTLFLSLGAVVFPDFLSRLAGLGLGLSMLWLAWNVYSVIKRYRQFSAEILRTLEAV